MYAYTRPGMVGVHPDAIMRHQRLPNVVFLAGKMIDGAAVGTPEATKSQ